MLSKRDTEEMANRAETWSKTSYTEESHELPEPGRGKEGFSSSPSKLLFVGFCPLENTFFIVLIHKPLVVCYGSSKAPIHMLFG